MNATIAGVRYDRFREAMSAQMDNEPLGMSATSVEHHLGSCFDCARWSEGAERVTRSLRLDGRPVPDLSDEITATVALPVQRVMRRRLVLRALLLLTGVARFAIGVPAVVGDSLGMAMSAHAAHETAAWNIAIGAAFLATAFVPRRAAGLIPLLGSFLLVLGVLSVHDLAAGVVSVGRLATHLAALIGMVLLVALDRSERALPPARFTAGRGRRSSDDEGDAPLRTVA